MSHELIGPTVEGLNTRYACSCDHWWRVYHPSMVPTQQEIESDYQLHHHSAGAEDLRSGVLPSPSLESVLRSMASFAKASVEAMEAMGGFLEAHTDAKQSGVGVVVARQPDGSLTSTPNVFVPAGTSLFVDTLGGVPIAPYRFEPEPSPKPDHYLYPLPGLENYDVA